MKEGQNDIYNIKGETVAAVSSSPFLEALRKKGLEALYVCDPVDEYAITQLKELDGKTLESCAKEGLDCLEERTKRRNAEIEGLKWQPALVTRHLSASMVCLTSVSTCTMVLSCQLRSTGSPPVPSLLSRISASADLAGHSPPLAVVFGICRLCRVQGA